MKRQHGFLTSFHRGCRKNAAFFPRPFCRQESHSVPGEAEVILQTKMGQEPAAPLLRALNLPAPFTGRGGLGIGGGMGCYKCKAANQVFYQQEKLIASLRDYYTVFAGKGESHLSVQGLRTPTLAWVSPDGTCTEAPMTAPNDLSINALGMYPFPFKSQNLFFKQKLCQGPRYGRSKMKPIYLSLELPSKICTSHQRQFCFQPCFCLAAARGTVYPFYYVLVGHTFLQHEFLA